MPSVGEFIEARDCLLNAHSYEDAKAGFSWPRLGRFNWALDYFDTLAERCSHPALLYVDDKGLEHKTSFQTLRERSNKAANFFRTLGLCKGDRILLMMPSCVELFECFLGAMKLGCVVIPASTLLTREDLQDRVGRGKARSIICSLDLASRVDSAAVDDSVSKICVGAKPNGWLDYADVDVESVNFKTSEPFILLTSF
jgi:acetyl-CoA synthetase